MPAGSAPGYRGAGSGEPGGIGHLGYSWLSASYDSDDYYCGLCLYFYATRIHPSNTAGRAYALQLHCLLE